jgi:hypothetical protein
MADTGETGARIERLLDELVNPADPGVARRAEELVRLVVELYGEGLTRIVGLAGAEVLVKDDLVASLLVLHDLHPSPLRERVLRALRGARLLGIEDGVVRVEAPRGTEAAVMRAVEAAAPDATRVEVVTAAPVIPVEALRVRTASGSPP